MSPRSGWLTGSVLGLVIIGHCAVNLVHFRRDTVPPTYDPAYHLLRTLDYADQLTGEAPTGPVRWLRTSSYYPPLWYWTATPFQLVWGPSKDAGTASLLIYFAAAIAATYGIGARLFSRGTGLAAAALFSLFPVSFGLSREFYPDLPVTALAAAGFLALAASDGLRRRRESILFGVISGLGLLCKWTYPIFLAGPAAWYLWRGVGTRDLAAGFQQFRRSGDRSRAAAWYLLALVLGAGSIFLWLRATGRPGRRPAEHVLMAVVFFHLFGAAMLALAAAGRRFGAGFPRVARAAPDAGRIVRNLAWAGGMAAAIAGPWYLANARGAAYRLAYAALQDAEARAMPGVFSVRSFAEYLIFLEGHQLHLVFFGVFVGAVVYHLRRRSQGGLLLLGTMGAAYLVLSLIRLKDPRFSMPYVPFAAVLMASFLLGVFRRRWAAGGLLGAVLGWGVFQMAVITFGDRWLPFGWGLPEFRGWFLEGKEEVVLFKRFGWGSDRSAEGDWQSGRILGRMAARWRELHPARVAVVGNHPYFHDGGFQFLARAGGLPLDFFPGLQGSGEGGDALDDVVEADFIVAKEGGDIGPVFGANPYAEILDSLHGEEGKLGLNFRHMMTEHLPDGSPARVYRRDAGEAWLGKPGAAFEGLAVLESYRAWPLVLEGTGEIRLEVRWRLHPDVIGPYRFFMHVYDRQGAYQFALDDGLGELRGVFDPGLPSLQGPVRTTHTIPLTRGGEEGLAPGRYQLAVGIWRPDDGSRLRARSDAANVGDIVHLDAPIRVRGAGENGG